jgi:hypothetical protein
MPQGRQSARRFFSRWNWDSPTPLAAGKCAPPPTLWYGGEHTRWRLKGWGSPNSNEGTHTVVLYIYKYFVSHAIFVTDCLIRHPILYFRSCLIFPSGRGCLICYPIFIQTVSSAILCHRLSHLHHTP